MVAKSISFIQFRNTQSAHIDLSPGINVLAGDNAQGKTNALEAIYLFALGRSFRTSHERDYVRAGDPFARITLQYNAEGRDQSAEICYLKNGRKGVKRNNVTMSKMSEFVGSFRAVIFCPEHLSIVKSGPGERRRFLDGAISQLEPVYLRAVQGYAAALEQRNKLLSSFKTDEKTVRETLPLWDMHLARYGAIITDKRAIYTEAAQECVKEFFSDMTGGKELPELIYRGRRTEEQILSQLNENRERDIRFSQTTTGPHKDDVEILINGKEARSFASQGQQRSLAIALKLAEARISEKKSGERPVLLLDDVLSELDEKRKAFILGGIKGGQVIITSCETDIFAPMGGRMIKVEGGKYTCI